MFSTIRIGQTLEPTELPAHLCVTDSLANFASFSNVPINLHLFVKYEHFRANFGMLKVLDLVVCHLFGCAK